MKVERFTDKQHLFCLEYLKDLNATQAAIRAGFSESTAKEQGYQLLQLDHVQERINELNRERMEKVKVDGEYIIKEFLSIINDDISNYLSLTSTKTGRLRIKWKDLSNVDTKNIAEISQDKTGFKFKRYSRDNALTQLAKHFLPFGDKLTLKTNLEKLLSEYVENGYLNDAGLQKLAEIILEHHKKLNYA